MKKLINNIVQIISQIRDIHKIILNWLYTTYQNYQLYKFLLLYLYMEDIVIILEISVFILLIINIILLKYFIIKYNIFYAIYYLWNYINHVVFTVIFYYINIDNILLCVNLLPVTIIQNKDFLGFDDEELLTIENDPIELARTNHNLADSLTDIEVIVNVIEILPEYEEKITEDYYSYLYILYTNSSTGEIEVITNKLIELINYKRLIKDPTKFPLSMLLWIEKFEWFNTDNKYIINKDFYLLDDILGIRGNLSDLIESNRTTSNIISTDFYSNIENSSISYTSNLNMLQNTSVILMCYKYKIHIILVIFILSILLCYFWIPTINILILNKIKLIIINYPFIYYFIENFDTLVGSINSYLSYINIWSQLTEFNTTINNININLISNNEYINLDEYNTNIIYTATASWLLPYNWFKKFINIFSKSKDMRESDGKIEIHITKDITITTDEEIKPYRYTVDEVLENKFSLKPCHTRDSSHYFDWFYREFELDFMLNNVKAIPDSFLVMTDNEIPEDNNSICSENTPSLINSKEKEILSFIDFDKSENEVSINELLNPEINYEKMSICDSSDTNFYENEINSPELNSNITKWLLKMSLILIVTRLNIFKIVKSIYNFIKALRVKTLLLYITPLVIGDISCLFSGTLVTLDEDIEEDEYDEKERRREERRKQRQIRKMKKWKELPVTPLEREEVLGNTSAIKYFRESGINNDNISPFSDVTKIENLPQTKSNWNWLMKQRNEQLTSEDRNLYDDINKNNSMWFWDKKRKSVVPLETVNLPNEDKFTKYGIKGYSEPKSSVWDKIKNLVNNPFKEPDDPTKSKWFD